MLFRGRITPVGRICRSSINGGPKWLPDVVRITGLPGTADCRNDTRPARRLDTLLWKSGHDVLQTLLPPWNVSDVLCSRMFSAVVRTAGKQSHEHSMRYMEPAGIADIVTVDTSRTTGVKSAFATIRLWMPVNCALSRVEMDNDSVMDGLRSLLPLNGVGA